MELTLEQQLSLEARQRELLNLYDRQDWRGLLNAAEVLNQALGQQQMRANWAIQEAASNLDRSFTTTTA